MGQVRTSDQQFPEGSAEVIYAFPALWRRMVHAWATSAREPRAWLMYSASYLVRAGEIRWAIDPVRLEHRLPAAPSVDYAADLSALSCVLLTHRHGDHLDLGLMHSLRRRPIIWVVPKSLVSRVMEEADIPASRIMVPEVSKPIELRGIRVTPFNGTHWEKLSSDPGQPNRGVPAMGYLVEHRGRRWLFPGDTRTYDAKLLPSFGPVDILFAHVWLGRAAAQAVPAPLVESFCRWCIDLCPSRVVLTHLQEFGREPSDYWDLHHAELLASRLEDLNPAIGVLPRTIGQSVRL